MELEKIIRGLNKVHGLGNINILNKTQIEFIKYNEDKNNEGVFECLKRKYVLCVTHDSDFRDPEEVIVAKKKDKLIFPPVKFSEVKAKNVVSSSPGKKIHKYLTKEFKLKLNDEATLLIGFDLK